ncbi:hypothetical protein AURDEDRAFT_120853 [Auricularia subglabra TFB-10046 SS5]|nr:hypothetical protein AURDEDRAFT_120853 [Auricularia subglabra TFB-10046 SS5]
MHPTPLVAKLRTLRRPAAKRRSAVAAIAITAGIEESRPVAPTAVHDDEDAWAVRRAFATQDGGAFDLDPTTNTFPAEQPSVVGESSSVCTPTAPGESNSARPGKTAPSGAAEASPNGNAANAAIAPGDGKSTTSYNDFMTDDEWDALYMSATQAAARDRFIGCDGQSAGIARCTRVEKGAPQPTTDESGSTTAPPTSNTCSEMKPDGPSADLSPANSGSTRTPDTTPELASTETESPARSTSTAIDTPPADVAPAQHSYNDGQSMVVGLGFPDASLEEFAAGLSPEAQQLAAAIAGQVGLPGDTQLAALPRARPSENVGGGRNHYKAALKPEKHDEHAPAATGRSALSIQDAVPAERWNESLSLATSIAAQTRRGRDDDYGTETSSSAAPAGLGQHAQANNTMKLSPGRAIEKYARDADRLHDEARLAVRIILRPEEQLPNAQPLAIAEWVKDDLRDIMGTQPDPTGMWTTCNRCLKTYRTGSKQARSGGRATREGGK